LVSPGRYHNICPLPSLYQHQDHARRAVSAAGDVARGGVPVRRSAGRDGPRRRGQGSNPRRPGADCANTSHWWKRRWTGSSARRRS
jgi:hypothetical protein